MVELLSRRTFLASCISAAGVVLMEHARGAGSGGGVLPVRPLGTTGHSSTIVAFGGIAAAVSREPKEGHNRLYKAIDEWGVNHVDVAPSYAQGEAERRIGEVMKSRRKKVFLACKTLKRTAREAEEELHRSLRVLNTDYFDLYQFHALDTEDDLKQVLGPGGAMELFARAQQQGKIRFIGVTGHRADTQLQLIAQAPISTVMIPVDFIDRFAAGLNAEGGLIPACQKKGIGVIGIKSTMRGKVQDKSTAYRYTLSQAVATCIPAGNPHDHEIAVRVARDFRPLNREEETALLTQHPELKGICRQCNYCLPCPLGINIPRVLAIWLRMGRFGAPYVMQWMRELPVLSSTCNRCGECERRCPYEIPIPDILLTQIAPRLSQMP